MVKNVGMRTKANRQRRLDVADEREIRTDQGKAFADSVWDFAKNMTFVYAAGLGVLKNEPGHKVETVQDDQADEDGKDEAD